MVKPSDQSGAEVAQPGSSSIQEPDYWWFRARTRLLRAALEGFIGEPDRVLDVGSADGPSVSWLAGPHERFSIDLDPRGLTPGTGVCASALRLPFRDASFDVVGAFDVIEHCEPESVVLGELVRVLRPGGRLLASVPAYRWAWSEHDVQAGHYRRYTRPRLRRAVSAAGLDVLRCSYGFAAVFPLFAAERTLGRLRAGGGANGLGGAGGGVGDRTTGRRLPAVSPLTDRLLMGMSDAEARVLAGHDLPFGSSVFLAAVKPT